MCCCGKPTINGEPMAYSWDGKSFFTRHPDPPALAEGDVLLYDEPGRCGGLDCHSHHFRLVRDLFCRLALLVRHGGGDERINLCCVADVLLGRSRHKSEAPVNRLDFLDSNGRYWLLHTLYSAHRDAAAAAREREANRWRQAAAEKRIKTRKQRGSGAVKVWIEPAAPIVETL